MCIIVYERQLKNVEDVIPPRIQHSYKSKLSKTCSHPPFLFERIQDSKLRELAFFFKIY